MIKILDKFVGFSCLSLSGPTVVYRLLLPPLLTRNLIDTRQFPILNGIAKPKWKWKNRKIMTFIPDSISQLFTIFSVFVSLFHFTLLNMLRSIHIQLIVRIQFLFYVDTQLNSLSKEFNGHSRSDEHYRETTMIFRSQKVRKANYDHKPVYVEKVDDLKIFCNVHLFDSRNYRQTRWSRNSRCFPEHKPICSVFAYCVQWQRMYDFEFIRFIKRLSQFINSTLMHRVQ